MQTSLQDGSLNGNKADGMDEQTTAHLAHHTRGREKGNRLIAEADHSFADRVTCRPTVLSVARRVASAAAEGNRNSPRVLNHFALGALYEIQQRNGRRRKDETISSDPSKSRRSRICAAASAAVSEIPSEERSVSLFAAVGTFYDRIYPSTEEAAAAPSSDSLGGVIFRRR